MNHGPDDDLPEPEETETTFSGNAALKAIAAAKAADLPALSDDSGLAVDALNGDPGIYAARWATLPRIERETYSQRRDFDMAMWHVNDQLGATDNRRARFICALCLAWPDVYPLALLRAHLSLLRFQCLQTPR